MTSHHHALIFCCHPRHHVPPTSGCIFLLLTYLQTWEIVQLVWESRLHTSAHRTIAHVCVCYMMSVAPQSFLSASTVFYLPDLSRTLLHLLLTISLRHPHVHFQGNFANPDCIFGMWDKQCKSAVLNTTQWAFLRLFLSNAISSRVHVGVARPFYVCQ